MQITPASQSLSSQAFAVRTHIITPPKQPLTHSSSLLDQIWRTEARTRYQPFPLTSRLNTNPTRGRRRHWLRRNARNHTLPRARRRRQAAQVPAEQGLSPSPDQLGTDLAS